MGLIKAQVAPQAVRFQWRDIHAEATQVLTDALRRSETIISEAQAAADAISRRRKRRRTPTRVIAMDLLKGVQKVARTRSTRANQELRKAVVALNTAAAEAIGAKEQMKSDAVSELVELAVAIAERVIKRQVMIDPQVLVANLREALALTGRQKQLRVAIHPSQCQVLAAAIPQLQMEWPAIGGAQIIEDESLTPGGCRVLTDHGQIDADLNAQLDRVIAGLLPPASQEEAA